MLRAERHRDYLPFAERLARSAASPVDVLAAVLQLRFRGELLERNYDVIGAGQGNMGDVYICFLRKKIEGKLGLKLIYTVRGTGYVLK